jgi:hypothetical protein
MVDKDELRQQMIEAFEDADYPVSSGMDLLPALPNGPATEFSSGDFSISVMELQNAGGEDDFPYESAEEIADDIIEGLEDEGYI